MLKLEVELLLSSCTKLFNDLPPKEFKRIERWAKLAKHDDHYFNSFSLTHTIYDCLWSIPKAIDEGFAKYLQRHIQEYEEVFAYHSKNCSGEPCLICQDRQVIQKRLGINYERKES